MVLELPPGSSPLACGAAALLLSLHITGGGVGLVSGFTALAARKGTTLHRRAGNWFFVSMLLMSVIGAIVADLLGHPASVVAGTLTFYLVATAWMTVKRRAGTAGDCEVVALVFALAVACGGFAVAGQALAAPDGLSDAIPSGIFAALAALGAAGDLWLVRHNGISGTPRIVRHLWRMCVALLIATVSLFLGQQQVFPAALRGSFLLFVPELAVLTTLLFWLIRTRARAPAPALR